MNNIYFNIQICVIFLTPLNRIHFLLGIIFIDFIIIKNDRLQYIYISLSVLFATYSRKFIGL